MHICRYRYIGGERERGSTDCLRTRLSITATYLSICELFQESQETDSISFQIIKVPKGGKHSNTLYSPQDI